VTDFGPNHKVIDKNGEEAQEVMLRAIDPVIITLKKIKDVDQTIESQRARVTLIEHANHDFQDGDTIALTEVVGMNELETDASINGMTF